MSKEGEFNTNSLERGMRRRLPDIPPSRSLPLERIVEAKVSNRSIVLAEVFLGPRSRAATRVTPEAEIVQPRSRPRDPFLMEIKRLLFLRFTTF